MNREAIVLIAFVANALVAGGTGVAIRFSNYELAPLWGAALRFALAAVVLLAVMAALRLPLPRGRGMIGTLLYGVLQFSGAFGLYYYALLRMQAGLGQVLLALVPLATLLLAVIQGQERLRVGAVAGALLGLAGVGLLASDPFREAVPLLSLLAVLGSVLCFGQTALLVRRFPPVHPVTMNALGMLAGALLLMAGSVFSGEPIALPQRTATWLALAYAVVLGSIAAFLLYIFVLRHWTASRAAYVMVVIPFVTVAVSAWLDAEPVGPTLLLGGLLIVSGVYIGALRRASTPALGGQRP